MERKRIICARRQRENIKTEERTAGSQIGERMEWKETKDEKKTQSKRTVPVFFTLGSPGIDFKASIPTAYVA
jgi:hypothetical protein